MSRARFFMAVLLLALGGGAAVADQHPNAARGFNPNGVYQMNGLDNISAFNGNLTISIPIGQTFPIGGGLSYQLHLYSNANIWDSEARTDLSDEIEGTEPGDCRFPPSNPVATPCMQAFPDRRANAGIGWSLSMGRLIPPAEQTNGTSWWIYESPDGSEHHFFDKPHFDQPDDGDSAVFYTRDGSYLRLSPATDGRKKVEFPNGEVHIFAGSSQLEPWELDAIGSQYVAEALSVSCSTTTFVIDGVSRPGRECVVSDGLRSNTIQYAEFDFESGMLTMTPGTDPPPINKRMLVHRVVLAAFGTQTAEYTFAYDQALLDRASFHTAWEYGPVKATVQRLRTLTLPDGKSYQFDYEPTHPFSGLPSKATLPTGGRIEWTWGAYEFPVLPVTGFPDMSLTSGVTQRRAYVSATDTNPAVWDYDSELDSPIETGQPLPQELKTTITDPLLNKTEHYFDVSEASQAASKYGLPFTPKTADMTGTRFLSTRFIPAGGTAARATYVRFELDQYGNAVVDRSDRRNARRASSRTVFLDDSSAVVDSDASDFDGLGHYRTITTSGTGVPTRVATTTYNPSSGPYPGSFAMPGTASPWLLETFTSRTIAESGRTARSDYDFGSKGALERTRLRKDAVTRAAGGDDVVAVFTTDSATGNLTREEYYGGDGAGLPTGALGSITLSGRQYAIGHEYQHGVRRRSQYLDAANTGSGVYVLDADIDQRTGVPSVVRDTAGVATTYTFDSSGRVAGVRPAGRSWSEYEYPAGSTPPMVTVRQCAAGATSCVSTALTESRQYYDGLGRLVEQRQRTGTSAWTAIWTTWDAVDRTTATTVPVNVTTGSSGAVPSGTPATSIVYDAHGRVLSETMPDGISKNEFTYSGVRQKTRKRWVWTGVDGNPGQSGVQELEVPVVEEYDLYGRLLAVTESSGPTTTTSRLGADVRTEYSYDLADRLTVVTMNRAAGEADRPVQQRLFDYDGRGFLRWESQPESGLASYTYDSRGHVLSKNQGAAGTPFDLTYIYDSSERLLELKGRNPFHDPDDPGQPAFRVVKSFEFATTNPFVTDPPEDTVSRQSLSKGKLRRASRFNYPDDPEEAVIEVQHEYHYLDTAGRLTRRVTRVNRYDEYGDMMLMKEVSVGMTYNDLDQQATITYPTCVDCGLPPETPARTITSNYQFGRLTSLSDFVSSVTYSPNGLRNVLAHSNLIADTQTTTAAMARPSSIKFATYDKCLKPVITVQPAGGQRNQLTALSVTVSGTGPFIYAWWSANNGLITGATGSTYTLPSMSQGDEFQVVVTGPCGEVRSNTAVVTVSSCVAPATGTIAAMRLPDGSWKLQPDATYRRSTGFPTFEWRRTSDNVVVGTTETVTVGAVTSTTTYSLTITDACGTVSGDVTITVAPQMPTTLVATKTGTTQITVTWPGVTGVSSFTLERRAGMGWGEVAIVSGTTYVDDDLVTGRTYAYRVSAGSGTGYSNSDVATTMTFTPAVAFQLVSAIPMTDALNAVNQVRAAAGWPAVTWSNILSPTDPLPAPGVLVMPRHVTACRARMNEALQALGAVVAPYTDADVTGGSIKAIHINEIQQRAY